MASEWVQHTAIEAQAPPGAAAASTTYTGVFRHREGQCQGSQGQQGLGAAGAVPAQQPVSETSTQPHSAWVLDARRPAGSWLCPADPACRQGDTGQQGCCQNQLPVGQECHDQPVPCSGATGWWAGSQASPLQLMTLFGLSWGEDGVFPLTSPSCPIGKPWSRPFGANKTAPGLQQNFKAQEGDAWLGLLGRAPLHSRG